jgi:type I restriction enzyme S subunit
VDDNWGGDIAWLTPEDIGTNVSNLAGRDLREGRRTLTRQGLASCATQLVPEGALIISIRAPIGYVGIARTRMCFNQGCKGLVLIPGIVPEYVYYALIAARPELDLLGVGTTFKELSRERLASVKLPFPPTAEEQRRIANGLDEVVSRMDEQIRNLSGNHLTRPGGLLGRMSALLLERRSALIAAAVTGQLLFPGKQDNAVQAAA